MTCHPTPRPSPATRWLLSLSMALSGLPLGAVAQQDLTVKAERRGEAVVVDVQLRVQAPLAQVWAVLTDFDHMADFLSSLKTSTVSARRGNTLEVAQSGEAKVGFMRLAISSVRAVELLPMREIRAHLVSGDFKSFESLTRLSEQAGGTLVTYHGDYVSKSWVPPGVGTSTIEEQTRKQYGELVAEIVRRHAAAGAAGEQRPADAAAKPAVP